MKKSTTTNQPQRKNNNSRSKTRTPKSKFQSVDIIRDNQPHNFRQTLNDDDDEDWEYGFIPSSEKNEHNVNNDDDNVINWAKGVTVEFDASPEESPKKKKRIRRATAQDKEVAELVHKVHLLCLLARGRWIDASCDDSLVQAALLSLVPTPLLKLSEATLLTAKALIPLVSWFHRNFHVRSPYSAEKPFHLSLASALELQGGSAEEVTALSVALCRALNLTTRFVSILDVTSLKPEADWDEPSYAETNRGGKDIFGSSTLMVSKMQGLDLKPSGSTGENVDQTSVVASSEINTGHLPKSVEVKDSQEDKNGKRKGDLEFEMQLQMALETTAVGAPKRKPTTNLNGSPSSQSNLSSPLKKVKRIAEESSSSSSNVISTAIGSRKVGAPLYWAEVYCSGENMTGKWVHVDVVNAIVDGELKVEALATACKRSMRYVVAFAGHGAKDVTRRYCSKWYKISPNRINPEWWDSVLSPLKELEYRATGGMVPSHQGNMNVNKGHESSFSSSYIPSRTALEDMELATRALTEPLPTNQQAYRNHSLYVIEKWLTKYQILHPKGPILGFCSGHAVYPRTCCQTLHTKERWLREGLQVREKETPAKVVKSSYKNQKGKSIEVEDLGDGEHEHERGSDGLISLFGKWQTEPLCLPHAVNGIVPKNERGQVDVWSEKCLPPGTIHLRLPRLVPIVNRLGIHFAPAMVGFEFRNGRSVPVYEGLVVCTEFRDAILEAYAEEEHRREEEEKKIGERQALSRWYQLLASMVTRQRLNESYRHDTAPEIIPEPPKPNNTPLNEISRPPQKKTRQSTTVHESNNRMTTTQHHEHIFVMDDETNLDKTSMTRTKRCRCGLSIEVEEM